jgi:alpha-L-rhamnosidase
MDWAALMIASDSAFDGAPLLRREVVLDDGHGAVVRATLRVTALGVFEAFVAGSPVSDEVLSPGWSAYEWRLRYREHDVTALVAATDGAFVLGAVLGNGWAVGHLSWTKKRAFYSDEPAFLAELSVEFVDGHVQTVVTDGSWSAGPSAVTANDLYDGETIDARLVDDAWLTVGASLGGWGGVHAKDFDAARLVPYTSPVVRRQERVRPVSVWTSPSGRTLVDFGQNLVGWIRLRAHGEAGGVITVRHAEVLEHDELGTRPLRNAQATDRFVLSGGSDIFEPTLTFHGFRYAEVDGFPGELTADDLEAVVVHTDFERTGTFECSDAEVNQLHSNVVWGLKGNLLDVPTDCPQRDERLGWTGDLAVVAPTAAYLFDVAAFMDDWLADLAAEQAAADGRVPFVIPDVLKYDGFPEEFQPIESAAIWSDVAAWLPWAMWEAYGDAGALARHLPAMVAHLRHVEGMLSPTGLWDTTMQFGDWLDPDAPPENPAAAKADPNVVATASFFRSAVMTANAARIIGDDAVAAESGALAARLRAAFQEHYVHDGGRVKSDCQTVYALAIWFGLLDDDQKVVAGNRLAELVEAAGHRISTGFAGTPYVLDALTATGHTDVAYAMLQQPEVPGWMYQVRMGATTMWERWDSMLPDGSINPGQMTSFNHYAFGSVADWLHRVVLGIAPAAPGYSEVLIAPQPGGGITSARGSLRTPQGEVSVAWRVEDGTTALDLTVPDGVPALVRMPGVATARVAGGTHHFTW